MAEVAGAVGNIAVSTRSVSPEMQKAVDAYNLAMGIIGVKIHQANMASNIDLIKRRFKRINV